MDRIIDMVKTLEDKMGKIGLKAAHNELQIVNLLYKYGGMSSMAIQAHTKRSISAHVSDLKRLSDVGALQSRAGFHDRRERFYFLSEKARKILDDVITRID